MKKNKLIIFLISAIFLLNGCAAIWQYELRKKQFTRNVNKGILVCSVIHARYGITRPTPSYYIRRIGKNEEIRIYGYNSITQSIFAISGDVKDKGPGIIKIMELPAGKYEIFKWQLFFNYGMSQVTETTKNEFSIPFIIKPDTINYIGQLALRDYRLICTDQSERDISKAYTKNSSLKNLETYKQILKVKTEFEEVEESDHVIHAPPQIYN